MVKVAGIDVGAGNAKAVILENGQIVSHSIIPVTDNVAAVAKIVTEEALKKAGISFGDLDYIVSTGYGRNAVPFANKVSSEIICHAKGSYFEVSGARTVIDIGAQDSKVIRINEKGDVINFVMNDKCAAGSGRFLEVMARVLGIKIERMGPISLRSKKACAITSTCTVFAESETIRLRASGSSIEDLIAGIGKAIATRVAIMGGEIGFEREIVFTGGVARNIGVRKALENVIGLKIISPGSPQIIGALGAALIGQDESG